MAAADDARRARRRWGVANIVAKKAGKVDMLGFVVWSSLVPPIPLFLLSLLFEGPGAVVARAHHWLGIGRCCSSAGLDDFGYGAWSVLFAAIRLDGRAVHAAGPVVG